MLAQNRRIEAGGHREEVPGSITVEQPNEVVGELLRGDVGGFGEEVTDVLVGTVEPLGKRVNLDAVAGREHHGLGDVLPGGQVSQRLWQAGGWHRHPLEQVERGGSVVQADGDDRQGSLLLVLRHDRKAGVPVIGRVTKRTSDARGRRQDHQHSRW